MSIDPDHILDPRDVVSSAKPLYWFSYGWPPIKNGVITHRSYLPDYKVGDVWVTAHCGKILNLQCTEEDSRAFTFTEMEAKA